VNLFIERATITAVGKLMKNVEFASLGKYLKEKRVKAKFTQTELAEALGDIHTQFVSNWERGLCAPPSHCFHNLIAILKLNRVDLVEVMLEDSKKIIESKVYNKKNTRLKTG
jgi:transcriptional regulator with XRE-family HTH domain